MELPQPIQKTGNLQLGLKHCLCRGSWGECPALLISRAASLCVYSMCIVVVGMFWCYVTGNLPVLSSSWPEFSRYKKPSKWGVKWGRHTNHPPQSTQCTPTTTTTTLLMVVRNQPARPPMDNNNGCGPAHLHHTDCKRQVHKMVHI